MKQIIIAVLLFTITAIHAQDIRVPFRVGDKFGLSDEEGNLIVAAEYDEINFMEPSFQYFQYTKIIRDSIETVYGNWEPEESYITGVLHKDKVLIEDNKMYSSFRIYSDHFIVGSNNMYQPDNGMLYNLKGQKLLDSEMKMIYFNHKEDVGPLKYVDSNLILVSMYHPEESRRRAFSVAVYDIQKQEIKQWIVQKVYNYEIIGTSRYGAISIRYTDQKGLQNKVIYYNSTMSTFVLASFGDEAPIPLDPKSFHGLYKEGDYSSYPPPPPIPFPDDMDEMNNVDDVSQKRDDEEITPPISFELNQDNTLYYGEKKVVEIKDAQYIMKTSYGYWSSPVIYKLNSKYGLIIDEANFTKAKYDTLVYVNGKSPSGKDLGYLYLTGIKDIKDRSWKYGVINDKGKIIIPIVYDCLIPFIPKLTWEFYYEHFDEPLNYATAVEDIYEYYEKENRVYNIGSVGLIGEQNGLIGIVNLDNEIIFPFNYDAFFYNNLEYLDEVEFKSDFMIIKKDDTYAMVKDLTITPEELDQHFIFDYLPACYYPNYGNKENFTLIRLITPDGTFCYAKEDGFMFYAE